MGGSRISVDVGVRASKRARSDEHGRDTGPLAGAGGGTDVGVELGRFFEHSTAVLSGSGEGAGVLVVVAPTSIWYVRSALTIRPFSDDVNPRRVTPWTGPDIVPCCSIWMA